MTEELTPVLFRIKRAKRDYPQVTAVFPAEPHDVQGNYMSCYVHFGQHGACDLGWYNKTRPASPAEYAELKTELEADPYKYRLQVYQRITPELRHAFNEEVRRMRDR